MKLTKEEQKAIDALKEVAKIWPESLWIFVDGSLHVMKKNNEGNAKYTKLEGVDQDYEVDDINIPCDGGAW
jgi:hypothetical protein